MRRPCLRRRPANENGLVDDRLEWHRTTVDGRPAEYGAGGSGPPVVFLHGWGVGGHAYQRAMKRLISRGCQVYAPSLPSFGLTADLPRKASSLDDYGDWVASFMETVGITSPAMVIGHSFGGGVAIKLAKLRPDLVSYLVLLNAVGGVGSRPLWSWVGGFLRELWPVPEALGTMYLVGTGIGLNLARNPLGVLRTAQLARTAELRDEAAAVGALGVPVLVLTSEGDTVIPRAAFETLCAAIGSEGRVVSGKHSWMLADPDSFSTALAALIDVQVAQHHVSTATSRAREIEDLLAQTQMSRPRIRGLLRDAPPLWLMSETPAVLAADLALCHPKLKPREVRAVARTIEQSPSVRLTVVAEDRPGLLADSAAMLASNRLSITHASAATWPRARLALHSFVIPTGRHLDEDGWNRLGEALRVIGRPGQVVGGTAPPLVPINVTVHGEGGDRMMVTIRAPDRVGVLSMLCRTFADLGANIEALQARASDGIIADTFLVQSSLDAQAFHEAFAASPAEAPT
jgi:pimeloyl-ACP methyl ester carboxylesterase/predicted amino acid-binding ACT domain protein